MTTVLILLLIAIIALLVVKGFKPTKGIAHYPAEQFNERLQRNPDALLIDVREPAEFRGGHLPRAINIPLSQLQSRMGELTQNKEVLLYCRSGMRSKQAGMLLRNQGIEQLGHLQGGIMGWSGKIAK